MTYNQIEKLVDDVFNDVRKKNFLTLQIHDLEKPLSDINSVLKDYYKSHNMLLTDKGELVYDIHGGYNEDFRNCYKLEQLHSQMMKSIGMFITELNSQMQDDLIHEKLVNLKSMLSSKES